MKKRGISLLLGALLAMGACSAQAAQAGATYVFPYEGLRYTQREDETVLTQTNLDQHEALIGRMGTTKEAILASYIASGIVMEVVPDEGGQIAVSVADAGDFSHVQNMAQMDEAALEAFAAQFRDSGMYESCELTQTEPVCVRLTSSAMYGSMPVYSLKYATLHLGRLYMLTQTIVGREPEQQDDARMQEVLSGVQLLNSLPEATPEPTPVPTPTPASTPIPTPGVARVISQTGNMTVSGVPAFTAQEQITVSGETNPGERVTVSVGDERIGSAKAGEDGAFSVDVKLPEEGELTLAVMTDTAEAMLELRLELPKPEFELLELESTTFTGEKLLVRGKTVPGARVRLVGEGSSDSVEANKNGSFSVRMRFTEPGSREMTFTVRADGYSELEHKMVFTRVLTERERINEFRHKMIDVAYEDLAEDPLRYENKNFVMRGRVMDFADFDGKPCALICVENVSQGVWKGPIWAVLNGDEGLSVESIASFYLVGAGLTLPADGEYTEDGVAVEAPVANVVYCTSAK